MSGWNYVVTANKPSNVTHSCVGKFTGPLELNFIITKCTKIEIHLHTPQGFQPMLDVPIYGCIATLELFQPTVITVCKSILVPVLHFGATQVVHLMEKMPPVCTQPFTRVGEA